MKDTNGYSNAIRIHVPNDSHSHVVSRINDFHILCIYDAKARTRNMNRIKGFAKKLVKGEKEAIPIFNDSQEGETFIVWEDAYKQNKELFLKLRMSARDDVFSRIATGIVAYFLSEYATMIQSSMSRHPELKDPHLLDISVQKVESMLRNNTFLAEETVWENFYSWFKSYLTSDIVRKLELEAGKDRLRDMEQTALNQLFYEQLVQQVQMDSSLMDKFIQTTEQYMQEWMAKIIPSLDDKRLSSQQLETFLGMRQNGIESSIMDVPLPITLTEGYLTVMSNAVYQSVREALSNHLFEHVAGEPWPTAYIHKGTVKGKVQIRPRAFGDRLEEPGISKAWAAVKTLSELDADMFDALCGFFLSNAAHHKEIIEIKLQDLLSIRGLKLKRAGNGRRGGYEPQQIRQVLKALSNIQDIWVDFDKVVIYEKGKPMEMKLQGRTFTFLDGAGNVFDIGGQGLEKKVIFTVGKVFTKFLRGSGRQIALLHSKTLQYNPYQMQWEKKIIRYLSWRWRTQARKGDYEKPHKVGSLLQAIGKQMNERAPSRTRERLEHALDQLQDDGLLAMWEYVDWDESVVSANGWVRVWESAKVLITPPKIIMEQYRSITRKNSSHLSRNQSPADLTGLGSKLKVFRKESRLTLAETAEELELSAAYVSMIERGLKLPSVKIQDKILDLIQR